MASPTKITYDYSFLDHTVNEPDAPQPGDQLDEAFAEVKRASDETIDRLNLLQRDDGELGRVVGPDQLKEPLFTEFENLANEAEASAQAAKSSETNAAQSATSAAGSVTAAKASETAAAQSATNSSNSAQASAQSAAASNASAQEAENSATIAEQRATFADSRANDSATSAASAANSASAAADSAQLAGERAEDANTALAGLVGGSNGQALIKASNSDFDFGWLTISGGGDMLQAIYDKDHDGVVDEAQHSVIADEATHALSADSAPWGGITGKPPFGTASLENVGVAGGVASLDAGGKVPSAQLPALTTTATVGAAVAGANGKTTPADGDFFTGVEAGGSTMFKTTWANIRATLKAYFDTIYQKALGFTPVRQFNSGVVSVGWGSSGLELNVDATWFGNNWPISISGRANGGANWADGAAYANTLGNGGWSLDTIKDQLNWRLADARSAGWVEWDLNNNNVSNGVWLDSSGYYLTAFMKQKITTGGYTFPVMSRFAARQPQIYIPNVGWRALGGW